MKTIANHRTKLLAIAATISMIALASVAFTPVQAVADGCCADGIDCRTCAGQDCTYGSNPSCGSSLPGAYCRLNEQCNPET